MIEHKIILILFEIFINVVLFVLGVLAHFVSEKLAMILVVINAIFFSILIITIMLVLLGKI